jgi:hypothetical protein
VREYEAFNAPIEGKLDVTEEAGDVHLLLLLLVGLGVWVSVLVQTNFVVELGVLTIFDLANLDGCNARKRVGEHTVALADALDGPRTELKRGDGTIIRLWPDHLGEVLATDVGPDEMFHLDLARINLFCVELVLGVARQDHGDKLVVVADEDDLGEGARDCLVKDRRGNRDVVTDLPAALGRGPVASDEAGVGQVVSEPPPEKLCVRTRGAQGKR